MSDLEVVDMDQYDSPFPRHLHQGMLRQPQCDLQGFPTLVVIFHSDVLRSHHEPYPLPKRITPEEYRAHHHH